MTINNKNKHEKRLLDSIKKISTELNFLKNFIKKDETANEKYNRLIINRAILRRELKELCQNDFEKFLNAQQPNQQKLICDYF